VDPEHWRATVAPEVKSLFGRPLRVLLAAWFFAREMRPTYLQEAQREMQKYGEAASGVAVELRLFVAKEMLSEFEDGRRVYFTPTPSPLWAAYRQIAEAVGLAPHPDHPGQTDTAPKELPETVGESTPRARE
jgi:hypothetical protein